MCRAVQYTYVTYMYVVVVSKYVWEITKFEYLKCCWIWIIFSICYLGGGWIQIDIGYSILLYNGFKGMTFTQTGCIDAIKKLKLKAAPPKLKQTRKNPYKCVRMTTKSDKTRGAFAQVSFLNSDSNLVLHFPKYLVLIATDWTFSSVMLPNINVSYQWIWKSSSVLINSAFICYFDISTYFGNHVAFLKYC